MPQRLGLREAEPPDFCVQINELMHVTIPVMLLPDDFRAYSKIKIDNHLFNK